MGCVGALSPIIFHSIGEKMWWWPFSCSLKWFCDRRKIYLALALPSSNIKIPSSDGTVHGFYFEIFLEFVTMWIQNSLFAAVSDVFIVQVLWIIKKVNQWFCSKAKNSPLRSWRCIGRRGNFYKIHFIFPTIYNCMPLLCTYQLNVPPPIPRTRCVKCESLHNKKWLVRHFTEDVSH